MSDSILNSLETTSILSPDGTPVSSSIDEASDQDWWRVLLDSSTTYTLRLDNANGSSLDCYLRLLDDAGSQLSYNDDGGEGLNSLLIYTPGAAGTYYVSAQGYSSSTGDYTLAITSSGSDIPASTDTTNTLTVNDTPVTSSINPSYDQDWWRVQLTAGISYTIQLNTASSSSLDTYLRLLDSAGTAISSDDDGGDGYNSLLTFTPDTSGTYYISAQGFSGNTGDYTLAITTSTGSNDILATTATSSELTINGSTVSSTIDTSGDQDWWRVQLTGGVTYILQQNAAVSSSLDSYLRLLDGSGSQLAYNDDGGGGRNSQITYTPTSSGTYYVSAQGFSSYTGNYTLTINSSDTTGSGDDWPANTATTASLTVNGSAGAGTIEVSGDQDWWVLSLSAGTTYTIVQNAANGSYLDTYLRLLDGATNPIAYDDDSGEYLNSLITFTPTTAGTYYLSAQGYSSSTGEYTLAITSAATNPTQDDPPATIETTSSLAINDAPIEGAIEIANDQDWWRVELTGGTTYTFLQNADLPSHLDSYLRLLDGNGAQLAFDDDSGAFLNSRITYTPSASATYYLSAQGFSCSVGNYTLAVSDSSVSQQDDVAGSTSTTATLTVDGAPQAGTMESGADQDWWQVQLNGGTTYVFRQNVATDSHLDPYLRLLDNNGSLLASNDDGGGFPNAMLVYTPTNGGSYYVSAQGYSTTTGSYNISVIQPGNIAELFAQGNGIFNGIGRGGIMSGGAENNIYMVDGVEDQISELGQNSNDVVFSWRSFTLGEELENMRLFGANPIDGLGNNQDNQILGNLAANALYGGRGNDYLVGGLGDDSLFGGAGDDIFVIGNREDLVVEKANQGVDSLQCRFSITLPDNVENLTLTSPNFPALGRFGRANAMLARLDASNPAQFAEGNNLNNILTGNYFSNTLIGNDGDDTLIGGMGNDTLEGDGGADHFRLNSFQEGNDLITDFSKNDGDRLDLFAPAFGNLSVGPLDDTIFVANENGVASSSEHRFIYNTTNNTLLFDPDGTGLRSAITLVTLQQGSLTINDISLVSS